MSEQVDVTRLLPSESQSTTVHLEGREGGGDGSYYESLLLIIFRWIMMDLPKTMLRLLSKNFEINLNVSSILLIVGLLILAGLLVVRYKYLTGYSKDINTKSPLSQGSTNATNQGGIKPSKTAPSSLLVEKKKETSFGNYLDEFLSAIKVFGYLDKAVFHELTKSMTTQKLFKDEIMCLDEKVGFSIVVEGTAQVYTKVTKRSDDVGLIEQDESEQVYEFDDYENSDEMFKLGEQTYQLLNEVKSGAPLSSLISTLDLFKPAKREGGSVSLRGRAAATAAAAAAAATAAGGGGGDLMMSPTDLNTSSISLNLDYLDRPDSTLGEEDRIEMGREIDSDTYPDIIIRPKKKKHSDSITVAIIPHSAFERVYRKYPKATSHIVTMALTRLYKVTMNTIHHYLGLTGEIFKSEVELNKCSQLSLPRYLVDGLLERLNYGNASTKKQPKQYRGGPLERSASRYVLLNSRVMSNNPGDLLSSVPISRDDSKHGLSKSSSSTLNDDRRLNFTDNIEETEDNSLRIAIIENIFKIIGINDSTNEFQEPAQFQSLNSSANSSVVGLNNFGSMSSKSPLPLIGGYHGVFKYNPNEPLMNTINISKLKSHQSSPSSRSSSQKPQYRKRNAINEMNIKDEFAKVMDLKYIEPDKTLVQQNSILCGLYYVINGSLEVHYKHPDTYSKTSSSKYVYTVNAGGIAGYLSCVVGFRSLVSIKTPKNSGALVAYIGKNDYNKLLDKFYFLQLPVAIKLKSLLSKQILTIDYALEWCHIPAGNVLCSQGDLANGFHVVLSGRFRVVRRSKKKNSDQSDMEVLGEYGHGGSIGEVEVLTASRRSNSLIAVRDSETARIPRTLFEIMSFQNPSIMVKVSRLVAAKVLSTEKSISKSSHNYITSTSSEDFTSADYKTITILPTVSGLPVREFADKLVHALITIGRNVIALDQASTLTHLGRHAFDENLVRLKLSGYFAYLEEEYETIIYICDTPVQSNWTSTCISQGDCILLLADADDETTATSIGEYEQLLIKLKTTARTDLCLIHREKYVVSGSTSQWLKNRVWVQGHHHIQMYMERSKDSIGPNKKSFINEMAAKFVQNKSIISKFEETRKKALSWKRSEQSKDLTLKSHKNDFLRLARILSNEAVGLVLGGGGSRGISHVGVVTALERHGIPVDLIGGTSIGSFVGGLYAKDYDMVSIYGRAKKFSKRVASMWRMIFDLTYPVTSYITGYEFNRGIWKVFGFSEIEDFWVKFFCNSTNITNSTMDIHDSGYAWRFIRASMSLAGLLPPIAFKGCMLLDGGYLDNLPVMEMKRRGAKHIIAVDVGSADDRTPMNYGDTLSGFWVLFNRWNPFSKHPNVPNMMDIQMRLAYVASVNALEEAKRTPGVYYLRPPIDNYATLDFGKFDEIYQVGLGYADKLFTEWEKTKEAPRIAGYIKRDSTNDAEQRRVMFRRNSI
ncbi:NTE1 [Candida oxycetoniae]|uniref:Lysophospholipase NTE1 n=1 Tax=Candida oxycetoniae TaxID=497107 RepID=A0AAI9SWQ1_9ASCO|nr:NTE1 [Candida oxycetoniae]KAI3404177.2 NTE1 [Candida oxycetoniae]